jgi:hypothetical protein
VGSVLAAVGTALPETMIPVVAILAAVFAGRDRRAAGWPRRARARSPCDRAAGEDQLRHLGEGQQGHPGSGQHNRRHGLPEHRPRYLRGPLFTPWELEPLSLFSVVLALVSGGFVYVVLRRRKTLQSWQLMLGGLFYLVFLVGAVFAVT